MPLPKFEDVNTYNVTSSYACTNEEPAIHRMLLSKKRFKRIGGISGGGDIPLFVLLSKCRELVVVDHSYRSLAFAFLKAAMLDGMGGKQMRSLLVEKPYSELIKVVKETYLSQVPVVLRKFVQTEYPKPYSTRDGASISTQDHMELRRELFYLTDQILERAWRSMERATFLHGDLTDLAKWGPFDCLYVSNAFQHFGRKGEPKIAEVEPLVSKRGVILAAGLVAPFPGWEEIRGIKGIRTTWDHQLLRRKQSPVKAPVVGPAVAV